MNNLKRFRKEKGVTQKVIAEYLGVTTSAYGQYETGVRQPNITILTKLADYFNVTIDDLLGREEDIDVPARPIVVVPELTPEDEIMLPVVASLRCGYNYTGEPYTIIRKVPVPKSYALKWGKDIVGIEAIGKSMLPTIRPKDICVCIPGSAWESGQIVVIDINDSDTIKRIYLAKDGGIDLVPDNEEFEPVHYTVEDLEIYQAHILGRVVKIIPPDL